MKIRFTIKTTLFFLLISAILLPLSIHAANGKLRGRVVDSKTGEPLAAANVVLTHLRGSDGREVPLQRQLGSSCDADGYYFIMNVDPGTYSIKASMIGYGALIQKDVRVDMDRTVTLDFELSSSSVQLSQVVVSAKKEVIKQDVSATQEVVSGARLSEMPVMRMDEFIGRVKGIQLVSGSEGNGLSVRGGAIRETDIRVDGMSLQDPRTENSYTTINSTTIEEIQVLTGGFEAKYGGIRSGLLNVVTKDGNRDRYTFSIKGDVTPPQKRYFGTNPWSKDSWIYKVYAGQYALNGVTKGDTTVPKDFRTFTGWSKLTPAGSKGMTAAQKIDLWKQQHPTYDDTNKPDYFFESSVTGPVPGENIPIWGDFAGRTTFLLGGKYENTQLAFPIGPRDNYLDWNAQIKLTTELPRGMKLSINGLYAKIRSNSTGQKTSYGGALTDQASSFGYLNGTSSSVIQQASLIGGDSYNQLWNKSRLQFYDERYIIGGAKFTNAISDRSFYTVEFHVGYTDHSLKPFATDSLSRVSYTVPAGGGKTKTLYFAIPQNGSPYASTNFGLDLLGTFNMYGGTQRVDSSHTYVYQFKFDYTAQVGRHHQLGAGFSAQLEDIFVNSGTWLQSQEAYTPDTWIYYKQTPLDMGLYLQDKIEFEGLILNAGLRMDYFNPMKKSFEVGFPLSSSYAGLLNDYYPTIPGADQSWQRWVVFRDQLNDPRGWPEGNNRVQVRLSPRMGVSFPITTTSKMYFNYGHFYQRAPISFMYNMYLGGAAGVTVPTPDLDMARTISYEFGYEQILFEDYLFNVTAYYKDVSNEPLARTFVNYYHDNLVKKYFADAYKDIRGIELRFEKSVGRFVTFNGMYDYMLTSSGQSGLYQVFENRLEAKDNESRSASLYNTDPLPRANINLNIHSPEEFGPKILGVWPLQDIYLNFFGEWHSGGRVLLNSEALQENWIYADVVDYWNLDFRASKTFRMKGAGSLELVLTIQNLTNEKRLNTANMTRSQYDDYKNSLKTPDKGGNDKWGEYDKSYIKTGWYDAPIFLNPRRFILGIRYNI